MTTLERDLISVIGFVDGVGFVGRDGAPLPVRRLGFYYGQDRLAPPFWCDLHDVQMGTEHCRCKP